MIKKRSKVTILRPNTLNESLTLDVATLYQIYPKQTKQAVYDTLWAEAELELDMYFDDFMTQAKKQDTEPPKWLRPWRKEAQQALEGVEDIPDIRAAALDHVRRLYDLAYRDGLIG